MRTRIALIATLLAPPGAGAQTPAPPQPEARLDVGGVAESPTRDPSPAQLRRRSAALTGASFAAMAAYGRAEWWQDGFGGGFKRANEGWFGRGTANGGADKLGHMMFAYAGSRLLTRAFEGIGRDPDMALRWGAWTAVGTLLAVEVADGYSRKWRFSHEDAIADLVGGALGWWMERDPALDDLVDLRLYYRRSMGPTGRSSFNPFGDYAGQRYLLVFKASGMPALRTRPVLRHLELSVGYGAQGFPAAPGALASPTRRAYVGVSLNLSELLRSTAFRGDATPSRTQRLGETFLEYVQVPAAGVWSGQAIR
ncbi:DUF2279 domain-containing protein [uncultured Piscinibacter sp.]|uniref:DUF2279 domain-containing protein n=1 Tax=uncultured Piscinibacter sp. TaxID=1131835 RepID=UPI0026124DD5|nr:DUF2279 domain-containing protein [uncultured Piscinibacter sp.]